MDYMTAVQFIALMGMFGCVLLILSKLTQLAETMDEIGRELKASKGGK
ncbi:MAG: hypothetical protein V3W34_09910 [Phycisphaerae bacterium]